MTNDINVISEAFSDAEIPMPTYDVTSYTLWLDESLDTCTGIDYRFIILLEEGN
jgi:hypothetical protein